MTNMDASYYEQDELWGVDHVFAPDHDQSKFEAVDRLLPQSARSVLDAGAGDGRGVHYLAERRAGVRFVAAERSLAALAHIETECIRVSVAALPFRARSFDAVICCEVLEHLPPPVLVRACDELQRAAARTIVVTVPNREKRHRSAIRCGACGCVYNPHRHLRSFAPRDLSTLFAEFVLDEVIETGPRQPVYPRWARIGLERVGVLARPGTPSCPQCGTVYRRASTKPQAHPGSSAGGSEPLPWRGYAIARRLVPKERPYYLCARFTRSQRATG